MHVANQYATPRCAAAPGDLVSPPSGDVGDGSLLVHAHIPSAVILVNPVMLSFVRGLPAKRLPPKGGRTTDPDLGQ